MKAQFVLFLSLVLLFACNKEDNLQPGGGNNLPDNGQISAKIDGKTFRSDEGFAGATFVDYATVGGGSFLFIYGWDDLLGNNGRYLAVGNYFPQGTFRTGTFRQEGDCLSDDTCTYIGYVEGFSLDEEDPDYSAYSDFEMGNVVITIEEIDPVSGGSVKGTFSGVIYDEITGKSLPITEGKFNVKIL